MLSVVRVSGLSIFVAFRYSMNTYPNFAGITVVIQFKYQVEQRRCFDLTITLAVVPDLQNVVLETPSLG